MKKRNVAWVTGAHGFIGRHVSRAMAGNGYAVIGIGHGAWPASEALKCGVSGWLNGDIAASNLGALSRFGGLPDVVVHLAGGSSVGYSIAQPREDFARTVDSTMELFEWLRQHSPKTGVLAASTAAVYGGDAIGRIPEAAPLKPYSPYGFHKAMMESICEYYGATFGIRSIIARLFSVYGAGLKKQLLWDLCSKLNSGGRSAELGGSGQELRDWVTVGDVSSIILRLLPMASTQAPRYNVGTGVGTAIHVVAEHVVAAWNGSKAKDVRVAFNGQSRPGDPFSLVASPEKTADLGICYELGLREGISRYVAWFKALQD